MSMRNIRDFWCDTVLKIVFSSLLVGAGGSAANGMGSSPLLFDENMSQVDSDDEEIRGLRLPENVIPKYNEGKLRVLALDGGGIHGVVTARILQEIEEQTGQPISSLFHMVVGTSAGSMAAYFLTMPDPSDSETPYYSAEDLLNMLYLERQKLFDYNWLSFNGYLAPKYKSASLKSVLDDRCGDRLTSDTLCPVASIAYDTVEQKVSVLSSWGNEIYKRSDAILASSAAPVYFSPVVARPCRVHNGAVIKDHSFVDGEAGGYNPALIALSQGLERFPHARHIELVSIGTGENHSKGITANNIHNSGLIRYMKYLPQMFFEGYNSSEEQFLNYHLQDIRDGGIYTRLNPMLADKNAAIDNISVQNLDELVETTEKYLKNNENFNFLIERLKTSKDPISYRN